MPLKGLTVISPHKEAALAAAAVASPVARRAAAANLLVQRGRSWLATTTDAEGVLSPLHARRVDVARRRVAVVGCGGAGRAAAATFDRAGADVTLVNRGLERGRFAASLLGLPFAPLADFAVGDFAIVVNATPCAGHDGEFPFDVRGLARGAIAVDLVVGAAPTPLVQAAEALGHRVIDGREVLLVEARRQFRLMTGRHMAAEAARKLLDGHGNEPADEAAERRQDLREGWQTAFTPHYASSFLGAAEAAYDYAIECITSQGKGGDPYVQQRVARMAVNLDTAQLWLRHVASLWDEARHAEAQLAGVRARHVIEHLAAETVDHAIRACGARSLIRPSPVERILRDLTFYLRHDNDDHILSTIGRSVLGQVFDPSFYKP